MSKPLAIDLYCGLGGWAEGLLAERWEVVGFDIERHVYGAHRYPAQLVLQDVLTLHGLQFRDADLIVASPPCQEYSYMAMPWTKAKAKAAAIRADTTGKMLIHLNRLFDACFRIQAQASLAAGRHIPMVVENVKGAQPWVGRARWNYGSYYLWGDVPALMPLTLKRNFKAPVARREGGGETRFERPEEKVRKNNGGSWFAVAHNTTSGKAQNPDGRKIQGYLNWRDGAPHTKHLTNSAEHIKHGGDWSSDPECPSRQGGQTGRKHHGSGEVWFDTGPAALPLSSPRRKVAAAMIAKIPLPLAEHIASIFRP